MTQRAKSDELIARALDSFRIELPSWGFANTGTRFGKFLQPAAAVTLEEKFGDAGQVHALTGVCPTLALHVLWDVPDTGGAGHILDLSRRFGVRPGSINPNLFQDQQYKFGSFGNPDPAVRAAARQHVADSIGLAGELAARDVSLWGWDRSSYPYRVFRVFHEIALFEDETGRQADVAYMIDQSHNLKGKIEAAIQTVTMAQELYAKAAIVDLAALRAAQGTSDLVRAEATLQDAFSTDGRPAVRYWHRCDAA